MELPRRRQAEALFYEAAELLPEERAAFLDRQTGVDPEVRREVIQLLKRLEFAQIDSLNDINMDDDGVEDLLAGQTIGPYKLLQRIGEGGFGAVYMAEQSEPIRRKVALKVIKPGMDTKQVIARFEAERQALAMMESPNIARVFDAGETDKGYPYFVMELVRGVPITEYCDANRLSARKRIALFIQVCRAVQHAHQKGIIHRDLKPTNIMVTLHDGTPVPKVIDFGIARATDQSLTDKTVFTRYGQFMGTPEYMSPEQAAISGIDVDTRSDIYSLGVLLYELLTGTTPFTLETLQSAGLTEMQRIIGEQTPPKPSLRISTLGSDSSSIARFRCMEPASLSRFIRGELDWIVMKALEKDRERRYETAEGLADDAQRFLNHEPVLANPPSRFYLFRKLVARNKAVSVFLTVVIVLIVGFGVSMSTMYARAEKERQEAIAARDAEEEQRQRAETLLERTREAEQRALSQAATASRIAQFMESIFELSRPNRGKGDQITAREILDQAAMRIRNELQDEPESQAMLMHVIGRVYINLGLYKRAAPMLEEAFQVRRDKVGSESPEALYSMVYLGRLLMLQDSLIEAESILRGALASCRTVFGNENQATLKAMKYLAWVLYRQEKTDAAEPLAREALKTSLALLGRQDPDSVGCMQTLSWVLLKQGKAEEAERLNRDACKISLETNGDLSLSAANSMNNLGGFLFEIEKLDEAGRLIRSALEIRQHHLGDGHRLVFESKGNLAEVYGRLDRLDEAESLLHEALAGFRAPEQQDDLLKRFKLLLSLAGVCLKQGRAEEARTLVREGEDLVPSIQLTEEDRKELETLRHRLDEGSPTPLKK